MKSTDAQRAKGAKLGSRGYEKREKREGALRMNARAALCRRPRPGLKQGQKVGIGTRK